MFRVVHFELSADDPDRAISFYKNIFGWKFEKWDGPIEYWLIMTGENDPPGIDGGMMRRPPAAERGDVSFNIKGAVTPEKESPFRRGMINTVDIPDIDEYIEKIQGAGGKIVEGKMSIPGVGYAAYMQDTEGNIFGIMENNINAE